jgi:glycerol-3-phosphate dehydrogenase
MLDSALSPDRRAAALDALASDTLDVLVIGGGVVGAGCALDAASRGLRVGLVEASDLASGTSGRSSKLIHGGLRYLEMLDFGLVAEALRERQLLLHELAPHLVTPVRFLYPLRRRWERPYVGAGLALYDWLARVGKGRGAHQLPAHRHLSRQGVRRAAASLRPDAYTGGILYYDAQVDDARHTLCVARTAAGFGAHVATRCRAERLVRDDGAVVGAEVTDTETGRSFEVRARRVVVATGVWTDDLTAGGRDEPPIRVRASKGAHVVVARDRIEAEAGMIMRTSSSVLFVIPWGERHWLIGTTDTDPPPGETKAAPVATVDDVAYLLEQVNSVLTRPLRAEDVVATYAGLRPLVWGESETTTRLSREHTISAPEPGLVVVAGGKYTTYRVMAAETVDAAVMGLARGGGGLTGPVPGSCTDRLPLVGADGVHALRAVAGSGPFARSGLAEEHVRHLLGRYGSLAVQVADLVAADPRLGEPLSAAPDYLRAEVVYAVTDEGALHLDDVMVRRTRIAMECPGNGAAAAAEVAGVMAGQLGWSAAVESDEVERYRRSVQGHLVIT